MTRLKKTILWFCVLAAVVVVASLDLNGLSDWYKNRLFIVPGGILHAEVDKPFTVNVLAQRPTPFGGYENVLVPADHCKLTMQPLDDHSAEFADFSNGEIHCSRRAILHVEFFVELLPHSPFEFINEDNPRRCRWTQFVAVDIDPVADWKEIDLTTRPPHIQRHMSVLSRTEFYGDNSVRFEWQPDRVVSDRNVTLMTAACVSSSRGQVNLESGYLLFDGHSDHELPAPPKILGSPAVCIFNDQWILAGGEVPEKGYDVPQHVFAMDLKNRQWRELPTLPDEIYRTEAVFEREGELMVVALVQDAANDDISAPQAFVLRDGAWLPEESSSYTFPVGNAFGVKTGVLSIATQDRNVAIKHLENGRLQTIALAAGYSSIAPITVIDNLVLQWVDGRVYELNPYLFLDKADIHTSDKTEGNGDE
jgi:hypothetical protein